MSQGGPRRAKAALKKKGWVRLAGQLHSVDGIRDLLLPPRSQAIMNREPGIMAWGKFFIEHRHQGVARSVSKRVIPDNMSFRTGVRVAMSNGQCKR